MIYIYFMNKRNQITALLALLLLALSALTQPCSLGGTNDLLQSGSNQIFNTLGTAPSFREHRYPFTLSFQVPQGSSLKVAASASSFNVVASTGLDFSIWGGQGTSAGTGLIVLLIDEDNTWASIKVTFLASARSDFWLGTWSAPTFFPQLASPNGIVNIPHTIPGWSSSQAAFTAVVEIAGINTAATSPTVTLLSVSINSVSGFITVQASLNASPAVETLVLTYIIFNNASPIKLTQFSVNTGSNLPYQFLGLDQIQSGTSVVAAYGFTSATASGLTCIGSRCPPNLCVSSQTCIANSGTLSSTICYLCATGQVIINGQCVVQNPCPANQNYNGLSCVCNSGYTMINSVCYVICGPNAAIINSQCQCVPGYTYSSAQNQCVQINCGTNFVLSNGVCVCPSPFGLINSQCRTCPANSYVNSPGQCTCLSGYDLNPTTLICALSCPTNAIRNSQGVCVCTNGYYNINDQCARCPGELVWSGSACTCPTGKVKDTYTDLCTQCNSADRQVSNGVCICSPTHYPTGVGCLPCPANSIYSTTQGTCVCTSGYYLSNGQCLVRTACPFNSFLNTTSQKCQCNTQGQYVMDGQCKACIINSAWNGVSCVCNSGYSLVNSVCAMNCGANAAWNGVTCVCDSGYALISNVCTKDCGTNATWNGVTCVCNSGFFVIGGACKLCDINSYYSSTQFTCICNDGYFGAFSQCSLCASSCKTCNGPSTSKCQSCAYGLTLSNGQCITAGPICQTGQYVNSTGQCAPCTANCVLCFSDNQCTTCSDGFTANSLNNQGTIITSCAANPTGTSSTITLRGNVLANLAIYQGVAMSVMPSAILANGCSICNDLFKIDVNSIFTAITVTQEFVTNTQYWFVLKFNFPTASFVPTFQYTVRINPIHANFFSSADMSQVLQGGFNTASFPSGRAPAIPTRSVTNSPRPSTIGSSAAGTSSGISTATILSLFS